MILRVAGGEPRTENERKGGNQGNGIEKQKRRKIGRFRHYEQRPPPAASKQCSDTTI